MEKPNKSYGTLRKYIDFVKKLEEEYINKLVLEENKTQQIKFRKHHSFSILQDRVSCHIPIR